ncbi:MAG: cyclic nucleotide-binding domain-containing protein [Acidobacteria bacterium]|nr:cyclic nucleotide-binding domain-containing protein [Acidobacteriota bacterium]
MALKDWLDKMASAVGKAASRRASDGEGLSIDDLITLERYDEALVRLKSKVSKNRSDYRSRIRLADLYLKTSRPGEAIEEYLSVADRYASEGFFDKGYALVAKLARMIPHEEKLEAKMSAIRRAKRLEHRRQVVVASLGTKAWAMEVRQHWGDLVRGPLVELLSQDQIKKLFPLFEIQRLAEGEVLVERGDSKEMLFVILTGELAAQVQLATGSDTDLRTFQGGDLIGDRALLQRVPWPATYRALIATKVLGLSREGLEKALIGEEDPKGLLNALRMQGLDMVVVDSIGKLKAVQPS